MGLRRLFKKARRTIKKLIPKEIRPFVPYIAAAIPGLGMGLGALGTKSALGSFLRAGIVKGLTDDEANLGDVLRTGAIAAAPQAIGKGLESIGTKFGTSPETLEAFKKAKAASPGSETKLPFSERVANIVSQGAGKIPTPDISGIETLSDLGTQA